MTGPTPTRVRGLADRRAADLVGTGRRIGQRRVFEGHRLDRVPPWRGGPVGLTVSSWSPVPTVRSRSTRPGWPCRCRQRSNMGRRELDGRARPVAEVPGPARRPAGRRVGEVDGQRGRPRRGRSGHPGDRWRRWRTRRVDRDRLGRRCRRSVRVRRDQAGRVGAGGGVDMGRRELDGRARPVAEVPGPARRPAGRRVGEVDGQRGRPRRGRSGHPGDRWTVRGRSEDEVELGWAGALATRVIGAVGVLADDRERVRTLARHRPGREVELGPDPVRHRPERADLGPDRRRRVVERDRGLRPAVPGDGDTPAVGLASVVNNPIWALVTGRPSRPVTLNLR